MARERIVEAAQQGRDRDPEAPAGPALRPQHLAEYIGQPDLKERLSIAIDAARARSSPMEHVLLHGPPGLGKTTLAHVIANEMGSRAYVTSGPALTKAADLIGTLTKMEERDVLFIDEIHRLPAAVEEYIYPAMEDFRIDFTVDSGMHARVVTVALKPFTLIGATTRPGLLTQALRNRFGIAHHLGFYGTAELIEILRRAAGLQGMRGIPDGALDRLAGRSRGTPRIALRLLRRVRDFAQVRRGGTLDLAAVDEALELEGIDALGLDALDRAYVQALAGVYGCGPAGVEAIAASMGEDAGTLEDVVEPYLLQLGFVARTRQGRRLTKAACDHVGAAWKGPADGGLFEA
jgi:Holliday junction DNA helicase RuvB